MPVFDRWVMAMARSSCGRDLDVTNPARRALPKKSPDLHVLVRTATTWKKNRDASTCILAGTSSWPSDRLLMDCNLRWQDYMHAPSAAVHTTCTGGTGRRRRSIRAGRVTVVGKEVVDSLLCRAERRHERWCIIPPTVGHRRRGAARQQRWTYVRGRIVSCAGCTGTHIPNRGDAISEPVTFQPSVSEAGNASSEPIASMLELYMYTTVLVHDSYNRTSGGARK